MREIADSAKTTYRSVYETAMTFYKQNKKGDLETAKLLGVELTKWHKEDEILYGDNIVATVDEKYMDIVSIISIHMQNRTLFQEHLTCMSLMMHFKKTVIEFVLWRNIFSLMLMI